MRYPTRPIAARRIGARRDRLCDRRHIGWALAEKESEHPASAPVADSLRKIVDDRAVKERRSGHTGSFPLGGRRQRVDDSDGEMFAKAVDQPLPLRLALFDFTFNGLEGAVAHRRAMEAVQFADTACQ